MTSKKVPIDIEDAYEVLDMLNALKTFVEQEVENPSLQKRDVLRANHFWSILESLRVRLLVQVKRAEGERL